MTLTAWLRETKTTKAALGREVGLTRSAIYWVAKRETTTLKTSKKIYEATGGRVSLAISWHARGRPTNMRKWERMVKAREYGLKWDELAERFGYADAYKAGHILKYAKRCVRRNTIIEAT